MLPHRQTNNRKKNTDHTQQSSTQEHNGPSNIDQEAVGTLVDRLQRMPLTLTSREALRLQSTVGNRAINRILTPTIQREPDDESEDSEEDSLEERDAQHRQPIEVSSEEGSEVAPEDHPRHPIEVPSEEESSETTVEAPAVTHTDATDDTGVAYDEQTTQMRQGLIVLTKPKKLRARPTVFSSNLANIPARRPIIVLAQPTKANKMSRSWMRVSVKLAGTPTEGYINTKGATANAPLVHANADNQGRAIMSEDGPTVADIRQHMFGDCYLLAALLSLTRRRPNFVKNNLFVTDPTQPAATHTLQFFHETDYQSGEFRRDTVSVRNTTLQLSGDVTVSSGERLRGGTNFGATGAWNWPAIVEKAFISWPGRYRDLDSLASGGQATRASAYLTGEAYGSIEPKASDYDRRTKSAGAVQRMEARRKAAIIQAAEDGDKIITASTKQNPPPQWTAMPGNLPDGQGGAGEMKVGGIAFKHVYELVSANDHEVRIRNPWGHFARVRGVVRKDEAESILTWDEFYMVVSDVSVLKSVADEAARNEPNGEEPEM